MLKGSTLANLQFCTCSVSRTQWCGTGQTADWHIRFHAQVVAYGHLHIPRTTDYDGGRFEEVSVGYPREWSKRGSPPIPRKVLPI